MKILKENEGVWDPNIFTASQFGIHMGIFYLPQKDNYTEMSSGVNHLPIPTIWKETMQKELEEDFLYQQYNATTGFQAVRYAVKLYERFLYSRGDIFLKADLDVGMTIGAGQAIDIALDYLRSRGKRKMLLVGLTYPLYKMLGDQYGYQTKEIRSDLLNRDMPTERELISAIDEIEPEVIVLCYPCNPSGEKYTDEELDRIMYVLHEKGIYCIFDCVCNMIISKEKVTVPEVHIIKHQMLEKCIIVNSLSKTESVPGFRIGYIAGDYDLMNYVRIKQAMLMNPPNMPTIAIWVTMLFRCLYLSEQYGQSEKERQRIIKCFKRIFTASTDLCSQKVRDYVKELVEIRIWDEYKKFKSEALAKEKIYAANKAYLSKKLSRFIIGQTRMDAGYNYLIKLNVCEYVGELELCEELLEKTSIAIFTESGFALKPAKEDDYWVRISLAVPEKKFKAAVDRMYEVLKAVLNAFETGLTNGSAPKVAITESR